MAGTAGGLWSNRAGYIGFEYYASGKPHFGWAAVSVKAFVPSFITGTVTKFAYETVRNESIRVATDCRDARTRDSRSARARVAGARLVAAEEARE